MKYRSKKRETLLGEDRLQNGYVIILPGIEGHSHWNRAIRKGLVDAGVPYAIEIHDWTRGPLWYFWNLRDRRRHAEQAKVIAGKIADYRDHHPGKPVYLIGHSGGGAMMAFALEQLPGGVRATAGIMLVAALSPWYRMQAALWKTELGIWNYSAHGDLFFVGVGTTVFGTCDGWHAPSTGLVGFGRSALVEAERSGCPPLRQMWFHWRMLKDLNLAGHLSCVNPRFVRNWIAPILLETQPGPTMRTGRVTPAASARELSRSAESPPAVQQPGR